MHSLFRNLTPVTGYRAVEVRVLDGRGRAIMTGAEVRVFESAAPRRLIGMGLVDTGSGYDAQSDVAVHVGVGTVDRVDVEVSVPAGGTRRTSSLRAVRLTAPRTELAVRIALAR